MEWAEFMQYIVDAVDGNNICGGEGKETVHDQLETLKALKYKRFSQSPSPIDQTTHQNVII